MAIFLVFLNIRRIAVSGIHTYSLPYNEKNIIIGLTKET
jgi:hypothetical protein